MRRSISVDQNWPYIAPKNFGENDDVWLQESRHADARAGLERASSSDPDRADAFRQLSRAERTLSRGFSESYVWARLLLGCRAKVLGIGRRHPHHRRRLCRRLHAQSDL